MAGMLRCLVLAMLVLATLAAAWQSKSHVVMRGCLDFTVDDVEGQLEDVAVRMGRINQVLDERPYDDVGRKTASQLGCYIEDLADAVKYATFIFQRSHRFDDTSAGIVVTSLFELANLTEDLLRKLMLHKPGLDHLTIFNVSVRGVVKSQLERHRDQLASFSSAAASVIPGNHLQGAPKVLAGLNRTFEEAIEKFSKEGGSFNLKPGRVYDWMVHHTKEPTCEFLP